MTKEHQQNQREVIDKIEEQIRNNNLEFTTVAPIEDYKNDPRQCLTSVHLPRHDLVKKVQSSLIGPLRGISPEHFYYSPDSLHMTIKNIRVSDYPVTYTDEIISTAKEIFSQVIPQHKKFNVYFYRLLLFPQNLALIGTTDPELDTIILHLDEELRKKGIPDDKIYVNDKYFFCNMTLARFTKPITQEFRQKIQNLSESLSYSPYLVDSVTLLTTTSVFTNRRIIDTWNLK